MRHQRQGRDMEKLTRTICTAPAGVVKDFCFAGFDVCSKQLLPAFLSPRVNLGMVSGVSECITDSRGENNSPGIPSSKSNLNIPVCL